MSITCSICKGAIAADGQNVSTRCGHIFHEQCLTPWLQQSRSCPDCRNIINQGSVIRVYINAESERESRNNPGNEQSADDSILEGVIESSNFEVQCLQVEVETLQEELAVQQVEAENRREEQSAEVRVLKATIENSNLEMQRLQAEVESLREELAVQLVEAEGIGADLSSRESQAQRLQQDVQNLRGELAVQQRLVVHLREELSTRQSQVQRLEGEVEDLREELGELQVTTEKSSQQTLESGVRENGSGDGRQNEQRQDNGVPRDAEENAEPEAELLRHEVAALREELAEQRAEVESLRLQASGHRTEIDGQREELSMQRAEVDNLQGEVTVQQMEMQNLQGEVAAQLVEMENLREELQQIRRQLNQQGQISQ